MSLSTLYRHTVINLGTQKQLPVVNSLSVFSFSTKNKKTLLQYQGWAEEPLSLQQSLGAQSPDASGTEAKKMCDATSQTTGVVCMIKHTISAGTQ